MDIFEVIWSNSQMHKSLISIVFINTSLSFSNIISGLVQFQGALMIISSRSTLLLSVVALFFFLIHIHASVYSNWALGPTIPLGLPNPVVSGVVLIHFSAAFNIFDHSLLIDMISSLGLLVSISLAFPPSSLVDPSQSCILAPPLLLPSL